MFCIRSYMATTVPAASHPITYLKFLDTVEPLIIGLRFSGPRFIRSPLGSLKQLFFVASRCLITARRRKSTTRKMRSYHLRASARALLLLRTSKLVSGLVQPIASTQVVQMTQYSAKFFSGQGSVVRPISTSSRFKMVVVEMLMSVVVKKTTSTS